MNFRMYFDPEPEDELDPKPYRDRIEKFMRACGFKLKDRKKIYDHYQMILRRPPPPPPEKPPASPVVSDN